MVVGGKQSDLTRVQRSNRMLHVQPGFDGHDFCGDRSSRSRLCCLLKSLAYEGKEYNVQYFYSTVYSNEVQARTRFAKRASPALIFSTTRSEIRTAPSDSACTRIPLIHLSI